VDIGDTGYACSAHPRCRGSWCDALDPEPDEVEVAKDVALVSVSGSGWKVEWNGEGADTAAKDDAMDVCADTAAKDDAMDVCASTCPAAEYNVPGILLEALNKLRRARCARRRRERARALEVRVERRSGENRK
jgi:hypothetical protein